MSLPLDTGCPERYTLEIFPAVVKIKVMQMSIMLNPHTKFQRRNNFEKYTFFGTLANSQMTFVWQVGLRRGILIANSRGFYAAVFLPIYKYSLSSLAYWYMNTKGF
jgi:hypothetical protein